MIGAAASTSGIMALTNPREFVFMLRTLFGPSMIEATRSSRPSIICFVPLVRDVVEVPTQIENLGRRNLNR